MTRRATWAVVLVLVVIAATVVGVGASEGWFGRSAPSTSASPPASSGAASSAATSDGIRALFDDHRSGAEVHGSGTVSRVLPDDDAGSRHQRFILALPDGLTVLVAHNIDIAPRLDGLRVGDAVEFTGEYEWSSLGGTVHWTHHDPAGRHPDGWLAWNGRRFG